jgi:glycosyltransferase involved in cell wall biosynthesis
MRESKQDPFVSIIVACYLDEGSVKETVRRINDALENNALEQKISRWEIIFVNDASPDDAETVIRAEIEKDPRVRMICHSRNFGSQMAFTSGILEARGDAIICMDGDLQDPPEVIPELIGKWQEGYEVVYGIRVKRHETAFRQIAYKVFYRLFDKLSYLNIPVDAGDFGIMSTHVAKIIADMPERDRFNRGLRVYAGFKQAGVNYVRESRYAGDTTNSFFSNIEWALKAIFSFSYAPLRFISYLSVTMLGFSVLLFAFYFGLYFLKPDAPRGFLTTLMFISFFGSLQLFCNAVIAEYIGRIFEEVKHRPRFIVRELVENKADNKIAQRR